MKKIRAAVVGYGNIGKYTIEALEASDDFEIAGVVRRNAVVRNMPERFFRWASTRWTALTYIPVSWTIGRI